MTIRSLSGRGEGYAFKNTAEHWCDVCGAVVLVPDIHTLWHERLAATSVVPL